jgi:hypothetical protein
MIKIDRNPFAYTVINSLSQYPVTLLLGPRQCGKTTLARDIFAAHGGAYFDLEDPECPLKPEIAKQVLKDLRGLVIIDEFQRQPGLFPLLRVLADRPENPAQFLVLGSASFDLVRGLSETLAGRAAFVEMAGFDLSEVGVQHSTALWIRGGFPRAYLAADDDASLGWRQNFIQSFLERDIPQLGIRIAAQSLRRFWVMLAHLQGQIWNAADLARSLGSKEDTARRYMDVLAGAFMVRQLSPWFENVGKRLVKAPKVYIRDSGILHALLGLRDLAQVQSNPKLGGSWEGFALEQVIRLAGAERESYFYKTYAGAELDLLVMRGGKRYGFEFKYADAPGTSKSMHHVMADLKLDRLWVVYPGEGRYPLTDRMEALPLAKCAAALKEENLLAG